MFNEIMKTEKEAREYLRFIESLSFLEAKTFTLQKLSVFKLKGTKIYYNVSFESHSKTDRFSMIRYWQTCIKGEYPKHIRFENIIYQNDLPKNCISNNSGIEDLLFYLDIFKGT